MDTMLVVVFDSEEGAREGSRALRDLDHDGSIAVYEAALVTRNPNDTATVKRIGEFGPSGTLRGLVGGSLIGALAGPAGLAVGLAGGTLLGAFSDFENVRVGSDFVADFANTLVPGYVALVAEIEEETIIPVDTVMKDLGGQILRSSLRELKDIEDDHDVATLKAEIAQAKAHHAEARADRKAKLEARIEALNSRLEQKLNQVKVRREAMQRWAKAKLEVLQEKTAQAKQDIKTKQQQRLAAAVKAYDEWLARSADLFVP